MSLMTIVVVSLMARHYFIYKGYTGEELKYKLMKGKERVLQVDDEGEVKVKDDGKKTQTSYRLSSL